MPTDSGNQFGIKLSLPCYAFVNAADLSIAKRIRYRTIESLCREGAGLAGLQGGVLGTIAQNRSLNAISTKIDA